MTVGSGRISAAGRGDPLEVAWAGLGQFPAEVLLELMVGSAQTAKVAGAGPAACAAVGNRVVEIAPPHGLSASREPAGDVPCGDQFPQSRRRPVSSAGLRMRTTTVGYGVGCGLLGGTVGCLSGGSQRSDKEGGCRCRRGTAHDVIR